MIEAIVGWNLWALPVGGYALYRLWKPKAQSRKKEEVVEVRRHYRRAPRQSEQERKFQKFKRNHMRGLKGNNPVKYARKKRLDKLIEKRDKCAEKCEHYYRLGEHKKAEQMGRKVADLDTEINRVRI